MGSWLQSTQLFVWVGEGGGRGVAGGGVGMADVVNCVCSSSPTANDDGGHGQMGGWGHFSKVNGALFTPHRRVSKVSPSF